MSDWKPPWGIAAYMGQIRITEYNIYTIHTHNTKKFWNQLPHLLNISTEYTFHITLPNVKMLEMTNLRNNIKL